MITELRETMMKHNKRRAKFVKRQDHGLVVAKEVIGPR